MILDTHVHLVGQWLKRQRFLALVSAATQKAAESGPS
jgi:hypothetical protein